MEKRVLLAVVLCLATLFVWYKVFPPPTPPASVTPPPGSIAAPAGNVQPPSGPPPSSPTPAVQAAASAVPLATEQVASVSTRLYKATVTSYGAAIASFDLPSQKYDFHSDRPALLVRFPQSGFSLPDTQAWTPAGDEETPDGGRKLVYRWSSPDVQLQKTLVFSGTTYQVAMTVEVKNLRTAPVSHHFEVELDGYQDPEKKSGGMFSARVPQNEVMWDRSGKLQSLNLEALLDGKAEADKLRGDLRWIGIGQQYFLMAAAMPHGPQAGDKLGRASAQRSGNLLVAAAYTERTLAPGESAIYPVTLYAGPKLPELLEAVSINGAPAGLTTSINYTLEVIARPLLWILRQLHVLLRSWALAIVFLTLLVKLVTFYPSQKSMKSMKAMGELKPQVDALKAKYGEDKERFNIELMALYKKHGVNPLGGCLPMLIQMPIYFALYSMLANAVELYRASFLWIHDLTTADPYFILPVATGGLMFLQTKLSPAPPDPQQKMMTVMMPIMFTGFSVFLPSGLTLYILTNTVLGMIQQFLVNRQGQRRTAATK